MSGGDLTVDHRRWVAVFGADIQPAAEKCASNLGAVQKSNKGSLNEELEGKAEPYEITQAG
jgi:hypothetical protein